MLKNIDPVLTPDILYALSSMGHGDEVVIVDAHYPAENAARNSTFKKLLRIDSGDSARAIEAVLSVFELDSFVDAQAERMMVDNEPNFLPNVHVEAQEAVNRTAGKTYTFAGVDRKAFYERAKKAYCVIITGETRGWGCFIFKKGLTVTPDLPASKSPSTIEKWEKK